MSEQNFMRRVLLRAGKIGACLFRTNVGKAWQGKRLARFPNGQPVPPGMVLLAHARIVDFGPPPGFSDLSGWMPRVITPADVGSALGQYVAVETKTAEGQLRPEQRAFLAAVERDGGLAVVLREGDDIEAAFNHSGLNHTDNTPGQ